MTWVVLFYLVEVGSVLQGKVVHVSFRGHGNRGVNWEELLRNSLSFIGDDKHNEPINQLQWLP